MVMCASFVVAAVAFFRIQHLFSVVIDCAAVEVTLGSTSVGMLLVSRFYDDFRSPRVALLNWRRHPTYLQLLLTLCGNVHLNPGPVSFPCTVCNCSVNCNHKALLCDGCQLWSHIKCVSVSTKMYEQLQSHAEFSWQCPSCLFSALPSFDVCDDSFDVNKLCSSVDTSFVVDYLGSAVNGMRIAHHNVQGITSKLFELYQWFNASADSATIYCLTETWLKPGSSTLQVPGFTVFTSPPLCRPGQPRSYLPGSCLIIPNSLIVQQPPICETLEQSCRFLNIVCCFVTCSCYQLCIVSIYRSPSTDSRAGLQELQHIITELSLVSKYIVIAGDFHIDLLSPSTITTVYSEFLSDYNSTQHIVEPSRVTSTSETLIDHILTTPNIVAYSMCQSVGLSDHLVQFLDVKSVVIRHKPFILSIRPFCKCDLDAIREALASTPWHVMDTFDDLDDKWHYYKSCLFSVLDQYAPLKTVTSKFSKRPTPWMTPDLMQAIKMKNKAKQFALKTKGPHDIAVYKSLKNKLKMSIHEAKLGYVKLLVQESKRNPNQSSQLWNSVNDIIGRSKSRDSVISDTVFSRFSQ